MAVFAPVRASVDWLLDSACFDWLPCWAELPEVPPELPGAAGCSLGPTIGLGADGQHDHIRDSVIPTFLHFNIPLLIVGWVAAMIL